MVEAEFQNIMQQLRHEASHEADPEAALKEIEGDADEYRDIAERRVRLGLLLSEIGQANGVEVSQQEMNRLIGQAAPQYQPKDRERFIQYVQQEPMAAAQLRAPLYEDKVVDFLFSKAEITERAVTPRRARGRPRERGRPCPRPGLRPRPCAAAKPAKAKKASGQARPRREAEAKAAPAKGRSRPTAKAGASPSPPSRSRRRDGRQGQGCAGQGRCRPRAARAKAPRPRR